MGIDPVTHAPRLDLLDISSILRSALLGGTNPNFLNILSGAQALMNPELLKLATLLNLKNENNTNLVSQNQQQINNVANYCTQQQLQSQVSPQIQFQIPTQTNNNVDNGLSSNLISNMSCSSSAQNSNPCFFGEDLISRQYSELVHCLNDTNKSNMEYESVLSTPLSTPTPLNSSSTYVNSSTEEERDTYCSDIFKFEIPESTLDINDFL